MFDVCISAHTITWLAVLEFRFVHPWFVVLLLKWKTEWNEPQPFTVQKICIFKLNWKYVYTSHPWFVFVPSGFSPKKSLSLTNSFCSFFLPFFSKMSRLITFDPTVINYLKARLGCRSGRSVGLISRGGVAEEQRCFEEFRSGIRSVAHTLERSGRVAEIRQAVCLWLFCFFFHERLIVWSSLFYRPSSRFGSRQLQIVTD